MKLYPPYIEGVLPAFVIGGDIVIPYSMNPMVGNNEFTEMSLLIKEVNSGNIVKTLTTTQCKGNKAVFKEDETQLIAKQHYKVQLAYISKNNDDIGYYSTVGVIKCCDTNNTIEIEGLENGNIGTHQQNYVGVFSNTDPTEKIYSYRFDIYDENQKLWETSGDLIYNSEKSTSILNYIEEMNNTIASKYSYDCNWEILKNIPKDKTYTIQFSILTNNQLVLKSPLYFIRQSLYIQPTMNNIELMATNNFEDGFIELGFKDESKQAVSTFLKLTRASETDNYLEWIPIANIRLDGNVLSEWKYKDFTVEQGIKYKYAWQQYNAYGIYSKPQYSQEVVADFEDMFLYDGKQQLKIRFNPKVTSFKASLMETKSNTIGGKYPFIFKNGRVEYKEFPISGLISYHSDLNGYFAAAASTPVERDKTPSQIDINKTRIIDTNLSSKNITQEREFKLQVLDWLNNGGTKLFRSPAEGNYLVRLMNVSLAPEDKLGRMLHTFSATAYEMGPVDFNSLKKENILQELDISLESYLWKTLLWSDIKDTRTNLLTDGIAYRIKFEDWTPGNIFNYRLEDDSEIQSIMIGHSGYYELDTTIPISELTFASGMSVSNPKASITYCYKGAMPTNFDEVTKVSFETIPAQQIDGPNDILNEIVGNTNEKELLSINRLKLLKIEYNGESSDNLLYKAIIDGNTIDLSTTGYFITNQELHPTEFKIGSGVQAEIGCIIAEKELGTSGIT